jgi:hypothetical protein
MKPGAVALIVGLVFVVGVGVGVSLNSQDKTPTNETAQGPALAQPGASQAPLVAPPPPEGPGAPSAGVPSDGSSGPSGGPSGTRTTPGGGSPHRGPGALPPAPPPPLPPGASKEADRIKRERDARGGRGGGRVTTLVEPKDPEERERQNTERMKSWERRLRYANDIRIKGLRSSVGLDAAQEKRLRKILDDELAARMAIVDEHRLKQISDTTFDEKVKANTADAQQKLQALLSPQQYEKYGQLKPREQVLRDDVK